ncbi:hypothetical protein N7481_003162 [Penicillium waksmanii]|uniref:uncharacterized protein n=1 Tax=Penicillium waksmanii TaxID=69791 RepID=UPI0025467623|nr:uncharacterized protein N7481_003162 [Penicillium waksmanii]KAJ5987952.1 hypothetical protein N7481_003162 [Penicillium waksmanii]
MRISSLTPFLASITLATANTLNITVLSAHNNRSTLECWALEPGFTTSTTAGTSGTEVLNLRSCRRPQCRWVVFLSGLAHITLPNSTADAYIPGGKNGAILALDTADVSSLGHITKYPSQESTVALQIPLGQGGIPGHAVLHDGACKGVELQV